MRSSDPPSPSTDRGRPPDAAGRRQAWRPVAAVLVALWAAAWISVATAARPAPAQDAAGQRPAAGFAGAETCVFCHETIGDGLSRTAHGRAGDPRSPASAQGCETCHGPGQAHAETADPALIRTFAITAATAREVNDTCVACHDRGAHAQWPGSEHDARNVACVTCHSVHSPGSETASLHAVDELTACGACHRAQALKVSRASHMPVREGKLACSSCHNPHGSTNVTLLRVGNWINESCVSCHAEKRGPFLWEHAAGRESCVSCHDPHGSSNDRMLIARQPMLCQRCHIGTRHPSTIYDDTVRATSNRLFGRSCIACHQNIHGSNHPSGHTFLR